MNNQLTVDLFKAAMPKNMRKNVSVEMVHNINKTLTDPVVGEAFKDNLVSYGGVMADGKFKLPQYVDAVKYVSFKLMGDSNLLAFTRAFPERMHNFQQKGVSDGDIAKYVSAYNKGKLVNLILEQTLVPTHILNAHLYQKALNVQSELMEGANSEKVRSDAANSILTHLKMPETQKVELDIGIKTDGAVANLRGAMRELANKQLEVMNSGGMSAQEMAHSKLNVITGECEEVLN